MNESIFNLTDHPAQSLLDAVSAKLYTLTDNSSRVIFQPNSITGLTKISINNLTEAVMPQCWLSFSKDVIGSVNAVQFDEFWTFTNLEIFITSYIPSNSFNNFVDIRREQMKMEYLIMLNLREPTADITTGLPIQTDSDGVQRWGFRAENGLPYNMTTTYGLRSFNYYGEESSFPPDYYGMLMKIPVFINNRPSA